MAIAARPVGHRVAAPAVALVAPVACLVVYAALALYFVFPARSPGSTDESGLP
jgi:hypothetical protein